MKGDTVTVVTDEVVVVVLEEAFLSVFLMFLYELGLGCLFQEGS